MLFVGADADIDFLLSFEREREKKKMKCMFGSCIRACSTTLNNYLIIIKYHLYK